MADVIWLGEWMEAFNQVSGFNKVGKGSMVVLLIENLVLKGEM